MGTQRRVPRHWGKDLGRARHEPTGGEVGGLSDSGELRGIGVGTTIRPMSCPTTRALVTPIDFASA
jgi:hypothetical protein